MVWWGVVDANGGYLNTVPSGMDSTDSETELDFSSSASGVITHAMGGLDHEALSTTPDDLHLVRSPKSDVVKTVEPH